MTVAMTPTVPTTGGSTLVEVTLTDPAHGPIEGAMLQIEAYMGHPGMAPVMAPTAEPRPGVYVARLYFSMAGAWVMSVTGKLADGRRFDRRVSEPTVRPAR